MPRDPSKARPSRQDREREKLAQKLRAQVDKQYRTRRAKEVLQALDAIAQENPELLKKLIQDAKKAKPPTKTRTGKRIYSGKGRSFEAEFAKAFWDEQGFPCQCMICKQPIFANGQHKMAPSIDHRRPWATVKTELETITVCKDGVHWSVVLAAVMRAAYQDKDNLGPAHQGCNSHKNGPKTTDAIAPQRIGLCPGAKICRELKAT